MMVCAVLICMCRESSHRRARRLRDMADQQVTVSSVAASCIPRTTHPEDPMSASSVLIRPPVPTQDPEVPYREHSLRTLLSEHGSVLMALLGRQDPAVLRLGEVTRSLRLGTAFAYDQTWPGPGQSEPSDSAEGETDSGFPSSSEDTDIP